jgi:hypothetical protein
MTPVEDIAVDMMNGGDSAIPPVTVKGARRAKHKGTWDMSVHVAYGF